MAQNIADVLEEGDRITQDGLWIGEVVDADSEQRTLSGKEEAIDVVNEDDEDPEVHTFTHSQINLYWSSLE